jgi:hypothetical protein
MATTDGVDYRRIMGEGRNRRVHAPLTDEMNRRRLRRVLLGRGAWDRDAQSGPVGCLRVVVGSRRRPGFTRGRRGLCRELGSSASAASGAVDAASGRGWCR